MHTLVLGTAFAFLLVAAILATLYVFSSRKLLDLVRADDTLWRQLGCPELVRGRDGDSVFVTVHPLLPWLTWVWRRNTAGLSEPVARRLLITSRLLRMSLAMFALASATVPVALSS